MTEKKTATSSPTAKAADAGQAQVQQQFDEANEKGYWGEVPDERPNEDYTLAGSVRRAKEDRK